MHEPLRRAASAIFCPTNEPWVMLDEHQVHTRIPDLVIGRVDLEVLQERIRGGWGRALTQTELRALHSMRPDRGRSLRSLADEMRVGEARAREVLRSLVAEGFAERTSSGSYARRAPVRPVLDFVVSVEAKRSDLLAAFRQARAHTLFADRCVVAFDLAYLHRAQAVKQVYRREGFGLLGLSAASGDWVQLVRPSRGTAASHTEGGSKSAVAEQLDIVEGAQALGDDLLVERRHARGPYLSNRPKTSAKRPGWRQALRSLARFQELSQLSALMQDLEIPARAGASAIGRSAVLGIRHRFREKSGPVRGPSLNAYASWVLRRRLAVAVVPTVD